LGKRHKARVKFIKFSTAELVRLLGRLKQSSHENFTNLTRAKSKDHNYKFMKFLIISDIHDNLVNLEKCVNWGRGENVENAICCGDIVNEETLKFLTENFKSLYLVRGNLEIYDETEINKYDNSQTAVAPRITANFLLRNSPAQSGLKQSSHENLPLSAEPIKVNRINYLGRLGVFEIDGKIVGLCHEPWFIKKVLELKKCDLVFYGHTHEPWISEKDGRVTANPGTLGGVFNKASFAVWDSLSGKLELKILELL